MMPDLLVFFTISGLSWNSFLVHCLGMMAITRPRASIMRQSISFPPFTETAPLLLYFLSDQIGQRQISVPYSDQKYQYYKYPPCGSHKGQALGKAECPGGASPVEEKVRIVISAGKIPVQHIAYSCIDRIENGRDDDIEDVLPADMHGSEDNEEIDDCCHGDYQMRQGVLGIPGIFAERGGEDDPEDHPREGYGYGSHELDDVPCVAGSLSFYHVIKTDGGNYRNRYIGLDGEVHEDAASAHEGASSGVGAHKCADKG